MKLKQSFLNLIRKLRGEPAEFPDQMVHRLISRLVNTREDELSCDEVFALVDEFVSWIVSPIHIVVDEVEKLAAGGASFTVIKK